MLINSDKLEFSRWKLEFYFILAVADSWIKVGFPAALQPATKRSSGIF